MQALVERAHGLKAITGDQRTSLYKQMGSRGWRKQEPASDELAPERPQLGLAIGRALRERGLTDYEIATLTGWKEPTRDNPFIPPPDPSRGLRMA